MTTPIRQPRLDDLTARFLARTTIGESVEFSDSAEVEPHEVIGGFRTDPKTGWLEVHAVLKAFGLPLERLVAPPEWVSYTGLPAPTSALPLAAGVFPQQVQDPLPLLGSANLTDTLPSTERHAISGFSGLRTWAQKAIEGKSVAAALSATGLLAMLGDTAAANHAIRSWESKCTGSWRTAWENQWAAILWLTGEHAEALAAWQTMGDHPVAAFNTGMALLFLGRAAEAVPALKEAAASLPPHSGWLHLANLLSLVAQARA